MRALVCTPEHTCAYTPHIHTKAMFFFILKTTTETWGGGPKCCFCFKSTEITGGGKGGGFSESAVRPNKFRKPGANCRGAGRGCHQIPQGTEGGAEREGVGAGESGRRDRAAAGPAVWPVPSSLSAPQLLFEQLCVYGHLDKPWHCSPLVSGQRPYRNGMVLLP